MMGKLALNRLTNSHHCTKNEIFHISSVNVTKSAVSYGRILNWKFDFLCSAKTYDVFIVNKKNFSQDEKNQPIDKIVFIFNTFFHTYELKHAWGRTQEKPSN